MGQEEIRQLHIQYLDQARMNGLLMRRQLVFLEVLYLVLREDSHLVEQSAPQGTPV